VWGGTPAEDAVTPGRPGARECSCAGEADAAGDTAASRGFRSASRAPGPDFEVLERRIDVGDLGLEIVGRGAVDPLLAVHLGLKGDPPDRWQDVLFLDTETTGLSGGTGTYVFLVAVAHFSETELVLRQHFLLDRTRPGQ